MDHLDEVRIARASLAWLFEPGDPGLRDLLAAGGPAAAIGRLSWQGPPTTGLRAEVGRMAPEQVWNAMTSAVYDAQHDGGRIVVPEDDDWPAGLADLAVTPPGGQTPSALCLWVRGDLPVAATLRRSISVTGARAATAYGQHVATTLSHDLAGRGWTVATTGGFGVETAAIRGALPP
jgi:DNA processing protein